ncbi:hypothetical protein GOP47_0015089 [Adiantum capillus-veneris]|uniref:Uncharacterized protein n=1 Tax=Adiantum capillus-veneris TaxID=13818 RepID=A0A9D4UMQ7_ADICA|nr:hypothetical protein GOP47_0014550 [Adiantum capillus-veneris]KAI5070746.1 hypothetical protein GOP47_0015089 [Adiantum capillus-veneris]
MAPFLALSTTSFPLSFSLSTPALSEVRISALSSARFKQQYPSSLCCRSQLPSLSEAQRDEMLAETFSALATSDSKGEIVSRILQDSRKVVATSLGVTLLLVALPASAKVTLENLDDVLNAIFLRVGVGVLYFLVAPLGVYYYLYKRWFKRKMFEAIFQLFLVFFFFPGLLLWAPFINFRGAPQEGAKEPWDEIRP